MRVIALSTLKAFGMVHEDAVQPLRAWHQLVKQANWETPAAVKSAMVTTSILQDGRVVFNLGGNKFRLVVRINYIHHIIYIRFIGTHAEYDRIDARTI